MPKLNKRRPKSKANSPSNPRDKAQAGSLSPKCSLSILLLTAVLATLGGWYVITQCDLSPLFPPDSPAKFKSSGRQSQFYTNLPEVTEPSAMAAGRDDSFFVSEGNSIRYYVIRYTKHSTISLKLLWKRDFDTAITALHFVKGEGKVLRGMLLVGLGNKIESVNPNQTEGTGVLFAELRNNSRVTSICTSFNAVFVADKANNIIVKYDMLGNQVQEIGGQEEDGFAGFNLDQSPTFSIDCVHVPSLLLATNPAKSRVEAFDTETGMWDLNRSWNLSPNQPSKLAGNNPCFLTVLPNQTVLTVEPGRNARFQNFSLDGNLLLNFEAPFPSDVSKTQSTPMISIGRIGGTNYATFILSPNGQLFIYVLTN